MTSSTGTDDTRTGVLRIDCAECVLEGTSACDDCVVTFIVSRSPGQPVELRATEWASLRALRAGGLAPALRHQRPAGARHGRGAGSAGSARW